MCDSVTGILRWQPWDFGKSERYHCESAVVLSSLKACSVGGGSRVVFWCGVWMVGVLLGEWGELGCAGCFSGFVKIYGLILTGSHSAFCVCALLQRAPSQCSGIDLASISVDVRFLAGCLPHCGVIYFSSFGVFIIAS